MTTSSPAKAWCSGGVVPYYATCVRDPFAANASVDPTPRLLGLVPDAMSMPPAMRRVSLGDLPPGSLSAMEARGQAGAAVDGSSSVGGAFGSPTPTPAADPDPDPAATSGAFYTLVPIRPRSRGERRSLRTFAAVSLRPSLAFNTRPRYLSTPPRHSLVWNDPQRPRRITTATRASARPRTRRRRRTAVLRQLVVDAAASRSRR